jgi:hypothetical protein
MKKWSHIYSSDRKWKRIGARLSIWSIRRHDALLGLLRVSMWTFSAVVLLAAAAGRLDLQVALRIIGFGGLSVVVLLTGLVITRKNVLLALEDPELRHEAHQAMLNLMQAKGNGRLTKREKSSPSVRSGATPCRQPGECG